MTTGVFAGLWDVVSCSTKEKYICKKPAEGVQVTTFPPTTVPMSCESAWTPMSNRNVCFKVRTITIFCENLDPCGSDQIYIKGCLFFLTHHQDFQKVPPAKEDLAGSTGLLQGHRWRPAEHTQPQGPAECSVSYLNDWFIRCVFLYTSTLLIRASCHSTAIHYLNLHGLASA